MKHIIEYVWSFNDINFNSILKISNEIVNSLNNLPICYIESNNKLIKLIPYKLFKCPFRKNNNIFVLCTIDKNNRNILLNNNYSESTFIEFTQQFYLVDIMTNRPLGFPPIDQGEPPNNDYYCGIGVLSSFGRKYMEEFTLNCLYSDVKIDTINSLSTPGHWQYKLHKFDCINSLDNLIASKFILEKICEKYNLIAQYNNLNNNNWKKSKLIIKFSRENMISNEINVRKYINALKNNYQEQLTKFYKNNHSNYKFSVGINTTNTLITVNNTFTDYIIDNRTDSNISPYNIIKDLLDILFNSDFCNNNIDHNLVNNDNDDDNDDDDFVF